MKNILFILFFIITNLLYTQEYKTTNYYGIKYFSLAIFKSEDSKPFDDILVSEKSIKQQIKYKTGLQDLNFTYKNDEWKEEITISISYSIHKNYYVDEQYYGSYELSISRIMNIPNSDYISTPHAIIFARRLLFVWNYPVRNELKKEIDENITSLLNEFALEYKSSY